MTKYNEDFTTISTEVMGKITEKVDELNCDTVFVCRYNNHPEDYDYLFMVIGKYKTPHEYFDGQYAVWTANLFGESASLCYGHYHVSFKTALEIIAEQIRDCNKQR